MKVNNFTNNSITAQHFRRHRDSNLGPGTSRLLTGKPFSTWRLHVA